MYRYFKKHQGLLKAVLVRILSLINFVFVFLMFNRFTRLVFAYFISLQKNGFNAANKKALNKLKTKVKY